MIDKEDFESWREHPITKAVFARLRELAVDREAQGKDMLYHAPARLNAEEWAGLQGKAAFVQGQNDCTDFIVNMQLSDLQDEEPAETPKARTGY